MTETLSRAFESDLAAFRDVFGAIPSTVAAIAAIVDEKPVAMILSSFTVGVSFEPPMVSVAVQNSSTTWPALKTASRLGVSVLGELHAPKTRQLASRNAETRLSDIRLFQKSNGAVFLEDSPTWLECVIEHEYPAGDHAILVLRVLRTRQAPEHRTLLWPKESRLGLA